MPGEEEGVGMGMGMSTGPRAVRQVLTYLALRACLSFCWRVFEGDEGLEGDAESNGEGRVDALECTGDALEDRADELGGDELEDELAGDEVAWKKTIEDARNLAGAEPEPELEPGEKDQEEQEHTERTGVDRLDEEALWREGEAGEVHEGGHDTGEAGG
jgi:hypothetical protein